jgi:hypothetical protein
MSRTVTLENSNDCQRSYSHDVPLVQRVITQVGQVIERVVAW